jgi:adenylate cyclase
MPVRILVVDDEADLEILILRKFRQQIESNEFQFRFAGNGRKALEALQEDSEIEIILSDLNMPEMDGLALLAHLADNPRSLKTIVVSAYGDLQNIRRAMNRGAFDFLPSPSIY